MKKLLSFVLAVLMVLSVVSASAENEFDEDFSIRNGIKYGMSIEEIKSIEIQNGNEEFVGDFSVYMVMR